MKNLMQVSYVLKNVADHVCCKLYVHLLSVYVVYSLYVFCDCTLQSPFTAISHHGIY